MKHYVTGTSTSFVISVCGTAQKYACLLQVANVDGGEVINGALKLAARLEQDRQETLESLTQEKIRVESLGKNLDKECERRLNLLPSVVQAGLCIQWTIVLMSISLSFTSSFYRA